MIESLLLEITNRCNKKCSFCYSNFESNGCDVDWATLENELRYMKENQIDEVVLSGGEPLLCRNFEEVLCTLYNHKKNITILSNGIALSNHNINLISEYNCKVRISLDKFDLGIMNNIRRLKEKIGNSKVKVAITYYDQEISDILELIKYCNLYLVIVPEVNIAVFNDCCKYEEDINNKIIIGLKKIIVEILAGKIVAEGEFVSFPFFNLCTKGSGACGINKNLKIDLEGNLFPCPFFKNEKFILCNVNTGRTAVKKFAVCAEKNEKCVECSWLAYCQGGCRLCIEQGETYNESRCIIFREIYTFVKSFLNGITSGEHNKSRSDIELLF